MGVKEEVAKDIQWVETSMLQKNQQHTGQFSQQRII